MGVRYEWGDEHEIIMNVYIEYPWEWRDYTDMMDELMPMLNGLNRPCATVVDCSNMRSLPKEGQFLTILLNVEKSMPANLFASAVVAAPYGVNVFMNMLMKLRPSAQRLALFANTMDEAYDKIYVRYREQYPDLVG